jgi:hypothetical protein
MKEYNKFNKDYIIILLSCFFLFPFAVNYFYLKEKTKAVIWLTIFWLITILDYLFYDNIIFLLIPIILFITYDSFNIYNRKYKIKIKNKMIFY